MQKKCLSVEIPERMTADLDELSRKSGRKKNLLVGASLYQLLTSDEQEQEDVIRSYIETIDP